MLDTDVKPDGTFTFAEPNLFPDGFEELSVIVIVYVWVWPGVAVVGDIVEVKYF